MKEIDCKEKVRKRCKHKCDCADDKPDNDDDDACPHSFTFKVTKLPAISYSLLVINNKVTLYIF